MRLFVRAFFFTVCGCILVIAASAQESFKANKEQTETFARFRDSLTEDQKQNPQMIVNSSELEMFQAAIRTDREGALKALPRLAHDPISQRIFLAGFEGLPPREYISVASQILELYSKNAVSRETALTALYPRYNMKGILVLNYEDADVSALIRKGRSLFAADPNVIRGLDSILSGRAKIDHQAYEKAHPFESQQWPTSTLNSDESKDSGQVPEQGKKSTTNVQPSIPAQSPVATPNQRPKEGVDENKSAAMRWVLLCVLIAVAVTGGALAWRTRRRVP